MNDTKRPDTDSQPAAEEEPAPGGTPAAKAEERGSGVTIASIGLLIAPLLAALGGLALTGTIGRVQRDYPWWISGAIGAVILSGVLWVAASTFTAPKGEARRSRLDIAIRLFAFFFAGVGFVIALGAAIATVNNEPRPQISPSLSEDGKKLTTQVVALNIPTDRRLAYRIDLIQTGDVVGTLYQAYVGPDSDGNVDQTVTLPLPEPRNYSEIGIKAYTGESAPKCDDFAELEIVSQTETGAGCVLLTLPQPAPVAP